MTFNIFHFCHLISIALSGLVRNDSEILFFKAVDEGL